MGPMCFRHSVLLRAQNPLVVYISICDYFLFLYFSIVRSFVLFWFFIWNFGRPFNSSIVVLLHWLVLCGRMPISHLYLRSMASHWTYRSWRPRTLPLVHQSASVSWSCCVWRPRHQRSADRLAELMSQSRTSLNWNTELQGKKQMFKCHVLWAGNSWLSPFLHFFPSLSHPHPYICLAWCCI